jgi:hypothetical protein
MRSRGADRVSEHEANGYIAAHYLDVTFGYVLGDPFHPGS